MSKNMKGAECIIMLRRKIFFTLPFSVQYKLNVTLRYLTETRRTEIDSLNARKKREWFPYTILTSFFF